MISWSGQFAVKGVNGYKVIHFLHGDGDQLKSVHFMKGTTFTSCSPQLSNLNV